MVKICDKNDVQYYANLHNAYVFLCIAYYYIYKPFPFFCLGTMLTSINEESVEDLIASLTVQVKLKYIENFDRFV